MLRVVPRHLVGIRAEILKVLRTTTEEQLSSAESEKLLLEKFAWLSMKHWRNSRRPLQLQLKKLTSPNLLFSRALHVR